VCNFLQGNLTEDGYRIPRPQIDSRLEHGMISPSEAEVDLLHSGICQALADPRRIQILYALHARPRHVTALADDLGIPQPTVSRHLRILRQKSLVTSERDGPSVVYQIADTRVINVLELMRQVMVDSIVHQSGLVGHALSE
jgi:DNA-binding transcriptional ArsR family regulator